MRMTTNFLAALSLTGCAALAPDPVGWDALPSHAPLPPVLRPATRAEIALFCASPIAIACAIRDYGMGLCFIIIPRHPMLDTLDHERKHCAGYDHGPYTPNPLWTAPLNVGR